ncbi:MAG: hypothetical protein ABR591_00490 [Candidatus Velthaea sp.]
MLLTLLMSATVLGGLAAIAAAQPEPQPELPVWNDALERRLLREGKLECNDW